MNFFFFHSLFNDDYLWSSKINAYKKTSDDYGLLPVIKYDLKFTVQFIKNLKSGNRIKQELQPGIECKAVMLSLDHNSGHVSIIQCQLILVPKNDLNSDLTHYFLDE